MPCLSQALTSTQTDRIRRWTGCGIYDQLSSSSKTPRQSTFTYVRRNCQYGKRGLPRLCMLLTIVSSRELPYAFHCFSTSTDRYLISTSLSPANGIPQWLLINSFFSFSGSAYVSLEVSDSQPVIPRNWNIVSLSLPGCLITKPTSQCANVMACRFGTHKCALAGKTCMRCSPFDLNPMIRLFPTARGLPRIRIFVIYHTPSALSYPPVPFRGCG